MLGHKGARMMTDTVERLGRLYEGHGDKLRYLVVGVFNTAFGYLLFLAMLAVVRLALAWLHGSSVTIPSLVSDNYFLIAQWTAWVLSVPVGTMTMKYYAFRSRGHLPDEIRRAYLVYLPAAALSSAILWFTVRVMHLAPAIGQLVTIAIAVVLSYVGHKYFTFRVRSSS